MSWSTSDRGDSGLSVLEDNWQRWTKHSGKGCVEPYLEIKNISEGDIFSREIQCWEQCKLFEGCQAFTLSSGDPRECTLYAHCTLKGWANSDTYSTHAETTHVSGGTTMAAEGTTEGSGGTTITTKRTTKGPGGTTLTTEGTTEGSGGTPLAAEKPTEGSGGTTLTKGKCYWRSRVT